MGDQEFSVAVEASEDRVIARVSGELDMATAGALDDALAAATSASHVVIDLSQCTFLDSTGIRAISAAARRSPRVSIVTTDPGFLRTLEITALDSIVAVHPSLEAAG